MRFTDWIGLDQLADAAPAAPALFQVRVRDGLLAYPNGKSAMFYYGYADKLDVGLRTFLADVLPLLGRDAQSLLVRWMLADDHKERLRKHLDSFYSTFGSLPVGNEIHLHKIG